MSRLIITGSMQLHVVKQPNQRYAVYSKTINDCIIVDATLRELGASKAAAASNDAAQQTYAAYIRYLSGDRSVLWAEVEPLYAPWKAKAQKARTA